MKLPIQYTIYAVIIVAVIASAVTNHYFPRVETKTVEIEKEVIKNNIVTVTHTVTLPNGSTETTTTTTDRSDTSRSKDTQITVMAKKLNVYVLAANDFSKRTLEPVYGAGMSKEVLGPITVGIFGLTNSTVGVTVGINF